MVATGKLRELGGDPPYDQRGGFDWDRLVVAFLSHGYSLEQFWDITPREHTLHIEAAAKRWEQEHNSWLWRIWHIAAFQRIKKLPDLKRMQVKKTEKPRQTWQQQLAVFSKFAAAHNAKLGKKEDMNNGG